MPDYGSSQALRMIGLRELAMTEPADIVERLRACANGIGSFKTELGDYGICDEAAAEITRLRAALAERNERLIDEFRGVEQRAVASARAEQKEACARVAEQSAKVTLGPHGPIPFPPMSTEEWRTVKEASQRIAAAIRAME